MSDRAKAYPLKQTSLANRLDGALGCCGLWLAGNGLCWSRCRRPIRISRSRDASVCKFQVEPRPRSDAGCGVQGVTFLVAHQRKTACKNAAIRQRRQQLAAVGDTRLKPLHGYRQRAPRALGETERTLAVAGDGLALRLRVGEL